MTKEFYDIMQNDLIFAGQIFSKRKEIIKSLSTEKQNLIYYFLLSNTIKHQINENNKMIDLLKKNYFFKIKILMKLSLFSFFFSLFGLIFNLKNYLKYFFCFELGLLSCSLLFISGSLFYFDISGQIYSLFILAIAAAETAIGLSILIFYAKSRNKITFSILSDFGNNLLK